MILTRTLNDNSRIRSSKAPDAGAKFRGKLWEEVECRTIGNFNLLALHPLSFRGSNRDIRLLCFGGLCLGSSLCLSLFCRNFGFALRRHGEGFEDVAEMVRESERSRK
jgi:hypothetical protein